MEKYIRRMLAITTCCAILSTLLINCLTIPASAIVFSGDSLNSWARASTLAATKMDADYAFQTISGNMNKLAQECTGYIESTTEQDIGKIMMTYGQYLAYMDWVTRNMYYVSDTEQYSIFAIPVADDGSSPTDSKVAGDLVEQAQILASKIRGSNLLSNTTDLGNGIINNTGALKSDYFFPKKNLLTEMGDLLGRNNYRLAVACLLEEYVDSGVLAILATEVGASSTTTVGLRSSVDSALNLDLITVDGKERTTDIATRFRERLIPYLSVYNQVVSTVETLQGRALNDMSYNGKTMIAMQKTANTDYRDGVSNTTRVLWEYMYASNASVSIGSNDKMEADVSNGALKLMTSNVTLSGDRIVITDDNDPELSDIGYVILSAGVTYDPFVSIAGNENYISTIEDFLSSDVQRSDVKQILQVALNTKKPLYVTDGKKSAWKDAEDLEEIPIADYHIASLADVLQIDYDATRAYAVLKGKMTPSQVDGSTWEYTNYGTQNGVVNSAAAGGVEITDDNDSSASVASGRTKGVTTVGLSEMSASSNQMTVPIMITSGRKEGFFSRKAKGFSAGVGGLTSLIIHNAALDVKGNKHLKEPEKELLFLNGLGDIVLSDNTVVLPAIANPLMYNYNMELSGLTTKEIVDYFVTMEDTVQAYYPYSAAFMNHYPTARVTGDGKLNLSSENDLNKYIISFEDNWITANRISEAGTGGAKRTFTGGVTIKGIVTRTFRVTGDPTQVYSVLNVANANAVSWAGLEATLMTRGNAMTGEGINFFPLVDDNADMKETYLSVASPLVTSAMRYVSDNDDSTGHKKTSDCYRIGHYIINGLAEGMLGTQYSETLAKNYQISYDDLVADSSNRLLRFLTQVTDNAIENLGRIDGVLAIKGPYDNTFFNLVLNFIQDFYLLIAISLLTVVAVKFLKGHYNLIFVGFIAILCIAGFEVYANWMPTLVPNIYNFAVNDAIEDVVWNTVISNAESYEDTYRNSNNKDPSTGLLKPYTATITLYTLTNGEMREVASRCGVELSVLRKGTPVYLDQEAGIFVQGNQIKMSVDKLLANNSMRGLYKSQWDSLDTDMTTNMSFIEPIAESAHNNPYSIQLTSPYVSLESYYTPFDHIERAFLMNLNTFANIFRMERNTYCYGNGDLYKDAFLFSCFINSGIFTAPGDDEVLKQNILANSIEGSITATTDNLVLLCNQYFYPQEDWLNLRSIFANPDVGIQNSLWGQMLQDREWYDEDWDVTEKGERGLADLIAYINMHTKQFIINNKDQLGYCSDENAIKIVSLYATTCFTHYVSEFGRWLYPNYLNASDIELQDVLYGSMTTLKDRNFAYDGTVTNTIALNLGVFGIIFLLLIVLLSTVFIFVITYLVPILYALFGVILIYKLINDVNGVGVVKGYTKVTLVSAMLYLIFSLSLQLVRVGGYNWYGYLGCVIMDALCVYFLFWVVLSVVQDFGELGNNTLTNNLLKGLNGMTGGLLKKLSTNSLQVNNNYSRYSSFGSASQYRRGYNVDDYDIPRGSRNPFNRFGASSSVYDGYGRSEYDTDDYYRTPRSGFGRFVHDVGELRRGWQRYQTRGNGDSDTSATETSESNSGG